MAMRNETYDDTEIASDDSSRSLCDECGNHHASTDWKGSNLCPLCLEEELENDHTLPRGDR